MKVTSANLAGNGGSAVDGEGEAPGVGVAFVAPAFVAEPAVSFEDLFWQADVKRAAKIAIVRTNRKIISIDLSSFRRSLSGFLYSNSASA